MAAGKREELRAAMLSEASIAVFFRDKPSASQIDYFTVYGHPPGKSLEPRHPIADQMLADQLKARELQNGCR